ncbi:MAG: hypothetical protein ABIS84_02950 [Arachnia sp.]
MVGIRVLEVDERDSSWEEMGPRFRVYLHHSGPDFTGGSTSTHDITGADVLQVIDWAQRQAGASMTYAVALVVDDVDREAHNPGHGRGLVWLVGIDGNDNIDGDPNGQEKQTRMLSRRTCPVNVPRTDAMPAGVAGVCSDGMAERKTRPSSLQADSRKTR